MRHFRFLLNLLLGLSLMTQGMAVAVALAGSPVESQMTSSSMKMDMEVAADMPCMDMMDLGDQAQPKQCPAKCCGSKACPDMSRCAQAQPALAAYALPAMSSETEHKAPAVQVLTAAIRPLSSLLRPPISLYS